MMPWGGMMGAVLPVMLMMWLAMLLFWAAVVLGLVALVRWAARLPWGHREEESDALEVARRRYARGEITREEYQRLRDELGPPPRRTEQTDTTGS
jgi:putative membrane protein